MNKSLFILTLTLVLSTRAQVGPGTWKDHLSLNSCFSVSRLGTSIYACNYTGMFYLDEIEKGARALNKINGLSDVGIKLLRANPYNAKLLAIYQNSNIDVLDLNNHVSNYPDLKLKTFNGRKIVNEVSFYKHLAYLACGFGIVLFDTDKLEIKDTYIIGPNGSQLEVNQVAVDDSLLVAATPNGIYRINYLLKSPNNFNNWKADTISLPKGPFCGVARVDKKFIAAYSPSSEDETIKDSDTLYVFNGTFWAKYPPTAASKTNVKKVGCVYGENFSIWEKFGPMVLNINTGIIQNYITSFNGAFFKPMDMYFGIDSEKNMSYWVADYENGLFQTYNCWPNYTQNKVEFNGINRSFVNSIDVFNGQVGISPSHPEDAGGTSYTDQGLNIQRKGEWKYLSPLNLSNNVIKDITYVYFDRKNSKRVWASGWFDGLLEYQNDTLVKVYNSSNSTMPQILPGNPRCTGLDMDEEGNLWIANSDVKNFLSVLKTNGQFQNFTFDGARFTRRILVDKNKYVWAIHERDEGITVFNSNNYPSPNLNVNFKVLSKAVGNGNLGSNSIYSIAEDKSGKIWVGTAEGVRVFYNPSSLFSGSNFDAQPIKIVEDGIVELLLGNEIVSAIVVDGADNKWMGTQTGGVFCFSPDGTKQLQHFTMDNSPLYSNTILDLNYDEVTGDIFIASDIGLQSYRSAIVEGFDNFDALFAYPNPVRPNYSGHVYIRGLLDQSVVKICDVSGNLVWEAKSTGGQLEWPLSTLSGSRVTSGVYVVYAATSTGEQKALTKILVMN
ncbi:MAG TPA: two-component regulator propeller domain-containing protein [Bacteroidia bacterium]|nr:two-component regulator propeller domain-containing protein [Bacteroidia bacterium]